MHSSSWLAPCLLVFSLHAQAPAGAPDPQAVASAGDVHAITLDVEVTDKKGAPIAGLKAGDFTLLDNRQPQTITSIDSVTPATPSDPPVEIILAIDGINTSQDSITDEFDWLHRFLAAKGAQLDKPVAFAILQDRTVKMQTEPTRDVAALEHFLAVNRPGFRPLESWSNGWGPIERETISIRAINTIISKIRDRPGRKLLIWIGPGWIGGSDISARPIGGAQRTLFAGVVNLWDGMRRANMTLDMIDPTISGGRIFDFNYEPFVKGISDVRNAQYGHLLLPALVTQSGGQILYGSSDLPSLIDRALADASSYYVVTYNPPAASHPDEYHAIEIKLSRKGASVRTRIGYYAHPQAPEEAQAVASH
jgi:VWFA-related protein